MDATDTVLARVENRIGRLVLNRPKALNALDIAMIRAIAKTLQDWRDNPAVHAVVIEGAGERAFCAGGDIRAIRALALAGAADEVESFFAEEYRVNLAIARFPVPWIALIDGICMGGGIGLSVHGTFRVATEHAMFAMPETAIAMFPDIGASYFLSRLPGRLGMYLGLTGARLQGADAVHAGFATHFVPRARLAALSAALAADGTAAVAAHAEPLPPFSLADHLATINQCFGAPDVPGILARLAEDGGDFARATLATLRSMSPSSVLWSHRIIAEGATRTLEQCLEAELRLTRHVTRHPDFAEGVRAMVIDKDRQPRWLHSAIEDVPATDLQPAP